MKKICLIFLTVFIILSISGQVDAQTDPKSGSTGVNAGVTQATTSTPTPTPSTSTTPTATPTNIPTATLTPTLAPGTTATPTPTGGITITNTPTPTLISKNVYINISGLASPNATIVMTSNDVFLRSAVANSEGYFSISQVMLDQQNGKFCLDTTDFKRIGSSYVCLPIPLAKEKFTNNNLFLPPTMGLSARKISYKGTAYAFGYTMPNSKVTTVLAKGKTLETDANDSGYYKVQVKNLPVGTYYLFATAVFEKKDSEKTDKPLKLQSLTAGGLVVQESKSIIEKLFSSIAWFIEHGGWLIIPIIILILILLSKRVRHKLLSVIHGGKMQTLNSQTSLSSGKKMHHDWML